MRVRATYHTAAFRSDAGRLLNSMLCALGTASALRAVLECIFEVVSASLRGKRCMTCRPMPDARRKTVYRLRDEVLDHFGHWEGSFVCLCDFGAYTDHFADKAVFAEKKRDFILLLMEYLGQLNNGHTMCYDLSLSEVTFGQCSSLGFSVEKIEGFWIVTDSVHKKIRRGWILKAVGDSPVDEFVRSQQSYFPELRDTTQTLRMNAFLSILVAKEKAVFIFEDPSNKRTESIDAVETRHPVKSEVDVSFPDRSGATYLRIPSFLSPKHEADTVAAIRECDTTESLVVDVRGNRGGNTPHELISALMNCPWRRWSERMKGEETY